VAEQTQLSFEGNAYRAKLGSYNAALTEAGRGTLMVSCCAAIGIRWGSSNMRRKHPARCGCWGKTLSYSATRGGRVAEMAASRGCFGR
jgi:hypothetical protein